jgi:hypothetical protein
MKAKHLSAIAVTACSIVAGGQAVAQSNMIPFGKETFQIDLGWYRPNFKSSFSQSFPGSPIPPGTINMEDDLGLDHHLDVLRLGGYWRFADKHRIFFGYYNLNRDTTGTLNKNIGPISIPALGVNDTILAGSNITAKTNWDVYVLGYGYSFYKTETAEVTGKIGFDVARISASMNGTLNTLANGVLVGATAGSNSDVTAPLPVIGLSGEWAFSPGWKLVGSIGGFKLKVNEVDASVVDGTIAVDYRLFRNFGVGLGYTWLKLKGDVTKSDWNGSLNWRTDGINLYGSLVF